MTKASTKGQEVKKPEWDEVGGSQPRFVFAGPILLIHQADGDEACVVIDTRHVKAG